MISAFHQPDTVVLVRDVPSGVTPRDAQFTALKFHPNGALSRPFEKAACR